MGNSYGSRMRAEAAAMTVGNLRKLRIAVDFDGVLHDGDYFDIGQPQVGAVAVMRAAADNGDYIIIHTCRSRPSEVVDGKFWKNTELEVGAWLVEHGIPFNEITALKPFVDVYLDDRAIQFIDWAQARSDLAMMRRRNV